MKKTLLPLFLGFTFGGLLWLASAPTVAAVSATGGTVVDANGYRIHTFTNSGSFNVSTGGTIEVLVVAGGGGGGRLGGGGGGGGLIYSNAFAATVSNYTVTVGGGGAGSTSRGAKGGNGTNSTFGPLTATGGGGGGSYTDTYRSGNDGGSGGGAACKNNQTGTAGLPGNANPPGQGYNGGTAPIAAGDVACGGGGGSGAAGGGGGSGAAGLCIGGAGGSGLVCSISGTATNYAGGGGGGATTNAGAGGPGGGGAGATGNTNGTAGTANTGGGGGGSRDSSGGNGGNGGSGIVIVRYQTSPSISNLEATSVTLTSAVLNGSLTAVGSSEPTASVYWGTNDGGTVAANWQYTNAFPGPQVVGPLLTNVTFPASDATYFYRFYATNSFGGNWADSSASFIAGDVTVQATDGVASEDAPNTGTFTISRPLATTNVAVTVNYTLGGMASNGVDYALLPSSVTLAPGDASTNVTVAPLFDTSVEGPETVTLTLLPGAYVVGASSNASVTINDSLVRGSGGSVTNIGPWFIHTFTNTAVAGNFVLTTDTRADLLVVGGGGAGGTCIGGGGGAGGVVYTNSYFIAAGVTNAVTVGAGGDGAGTPAASSGWTHGTNGANSSFGALLAYGGGGGAGWTEKIAFAGGSGGGGANGCAPGSYTNGQGCLGGTSSGNPAGGGGGAASPGGAGSGSLAGNGGTGLAFSISGTLTNYAGGGGGGARGSSGITSAGTGGLGGGGNGGPSTGMGSNGGAGTGGGGGGGGWNGTTGYGGGKGGSGIVIVRYDVMNPDIVDLPATNITATSGVLNGYLYSTGATPTYVTVYSGTNDGGTNMAAWAQTNALGVQCIGPVATNLSLSATNANYYYRYYASNSYGTVWASASASFFVGSVTVVATDPTASEIGPDSGTFTIYRPDTTTNDALVVNYALSGVASNGLDYTALSGVVTVAVGNASATVTITPILDMVEEGLEDVVLTLTSGNYVIGSPNSATVTISNSPIAQTLYKFDNTLPLNSDGLSTNGRLALGTATTKGDNKGVYPGSVIKTDTNYMMWYFGNDNSGKWRIFLATSPDAMTWTKYSNGVPVVSDSVCSDGMIPLGSGDRGDYNHALYPTVIKDGPAFKMWYAGCDGASTPTYRIFHATSTNGIDWVKYNNFIPPSSDTTSGGGRLPTGLAAARGDLTYAYIPCVIRDGPIYRMWYAGYNAGSTMVYSATSPDGFTWTKSTNTVSARNDATGTFGRIPLGAATNSGDFANTLRARVVQQGMQYLMWYDGVDTNGGYRIYRASSFDSVSWTKTDNTIPPNSNVGSSNGRIAAGTAGRGDTWGVGNAVVLDDGPVYRFWYMGSGQGTARVYSALWFPDTPNVSVAGISNVSTTAATLYGSLTSTGFTPTAVSCCWGVSDGGTNPAAWTSNTLISANAGTGAVSIALDNLSEGTAYAFRFLATNSAGACMSAPLGSFITAPVEVSSPWRGAFVFTRPASTTNLALAVNYTLGGTATNWADYYPLSGQDWIPAGATSTLVYVRANLPGQLAGKNVTLTLAPGGYTIGSSSSATTSFDPATWYVATNGVDGIAGTNAAAPLRTVAHAIDRAIDGDTILVSNGTYAVSDMLTLTAGITIRGLPANRNSIIRRSGGTGSLPYFRVAYVNHANAMLDGLTLANGLVQYDADPLGGGLKLLSGTVTNCAIANNISQPGGTDNPSGCGAYVAGGLLIGSTVSGNHNANSGAGRESMRGGGLYLNGGTVRGCLIENNFVADDNACKAGGVYITGGLLTHSTIRSNHVDYSAASGGKLGGGVYSTGGTIRNCLVYGNWSREHAGGGYVAGGQWQNCVVIGNSAGVTNGGLFVAGGSVTNTIVYNNFASYLTNVAGSWAGRVNYSCAPELGSGTSNTTFDPLFADNGTGSGTGSNSTYQPGDFHLQTNSPCLAAGMTQDWMAAEVDLEGHPRQSGDVVDLGVFERVKFDEAAGVTLTLPATNITPTSVTLVGYLDSTGTSATAASVYWGTTDGSTNAGNWQHTNVFAGPLDLGPLSTNVTLPGSNVTYYYRYCASNAFGASWSTSAVFFIAGDVTIEATDPTASEVGPETGVFTVTRPAGATNEPLDVWYTVDGTASNGVDYVPLSGLVTIARGASNATITVTPLTDFEEEAVEDVTLTLAGGAYEIGTPDSATVNIANSTVGQTVYKMDNTIPLASDGSSTNARLGLGTVSAKGDYKQIVAGTVIKTETNYLMWYSGNDNSGNWRIYLATSPDALTWTKYSNAVPNASDGLSANGTIPLGSGDRGDTTHALSPTVIKDGPIYKMWYVGYDASSYHNFYSPFAPYARIYHATSTNGIDWVKYNNFIVPSSDTTSGGGRLPTGLTSGRGDEMHTFAPCVIRDGPVYRMWYSGTRRSNGSPPPSTSITSAIFSATSPDGFVWTKVNSAVSAASDTNGDNGRIPVGATADRGDCLRTYAPCVVQQGMQYLMWYSGLSATASPRIYRARSMDSLNWTKDDNTIPAATDGGSSNGRIAAGSAGSGDSSGVSSPVVLEDGPVYRFWYNGSGQGTSRVYGAVWVPDAPTVHAAGASNVSASAATLYGNLTSTGLAATAVACCWGPTDGGTNAAAWQSNALIAASSPVGPVSITVGGLASGSSYAFRFLASNANGQCMSAPLGSFITAPVDVQSPWRGAFMVSRPLSATNFDLAVNYTLSGTATNWVDYYPLTGQDWIRAGATSALIYVRANLPGRLAGKTVTLTLAPGGYLAGSSTAATTTFDPITWYVATNGVDATAGTNPAAPLRTPAHAIERATDGDTVLLSKGTYTVSDMLPVVAGITIRGYPANRNSTVQRTGAGNSLPYFRLFHVNHTNALLDGLRIQGGAAGYDCDGNGGGIKLLNGTVTNCTLAGNVARTAGCGVYVNAGLLIDSTLSGNNNASVEGMTGGGLYLANGTVRGCLIEKNYVDDDGNSYGGGVYITGGLLSHCTIRSNHVDRTTSGQKYGGGVYSAGGSVRNCLIYGNWSTVLAGGGYVAGGQWQNCVVVGNSAGVTNGGLYVAGGGVTNSIIFYNAGAGDTNVAGSWAGRVAYSCAPELTSGTGNTSAPPQFVNSGTGAGASYQPGDYHFIIGSACLGSGITQSWMAAEVDMEGRPRLSGGPIDLGIYQISGPRGSVFTFR